MRTHIRIVTPLLFLLLAVGSSTAQSVPPTEARAGMGESKRRTAEENRQKPRRRHFLLRPWLFDKKAGKLWLRMAPLAAGVILDARSSSLVGVRRPGSVETNPFLPKHPTDGQFVAYGIVYFVGQLYATQWMMDYAAGIEPSENRFNDWFWRGGGVVFLYTGGVGGLHGMAASHNYKLITCPSGYYKPIGKPGCLPQ